MTFCLSLPVSHVHHTAHMKSSHGSRVWSVSEEAQSPLNTVCYMKNVPGMQSLLTVPTKHMSIDSLSTNNTCSVLKKSYIFQKQKRSCTSTTFHPVKWKFHLLVAADYKEANLSNTTSPQVRLNRGRQLAVSDSGQREGRGGVRYLGHGQH